MAYDDDSDQIEDEAPAGNDDADLHAEAVERFDYIIQAVQEERMMALTDRRFVTIAGAQWEGAWATQFANSIMVEVNKTAQGVEKIITDYRSNRVTVNFRAVGKDASEQTAETLNGMYRADLYNSKGQQAIDNAFEEAVQGGIGAWRLTNRYEDEYDPESDAQVIAFEAIVDADQSVFWDMNAKLYDKSDAKYCFVITAMARDAFEEEYGPDAISDWPDEIPKLHYDWFTPDVVRIAEYYCVEEQAGQLMIFEHKATGEQRREWKADLEPGERAQLEAEGWKLLRTRSAKRRRINKSVLSGMEVLKKPKRIAGDCIPVVPIYGKRWFIDNMERSRGHVRLAMDPQRIYNAQISKLTETAALAPIERPIFTPEQIAGHENSWASANIDRAPYALINAIIGPDGSPIPTGPVGTVTPPTLSPVLAALIQITAADIADLTSSDDGADQVRANISAEAMDIAATRTDAKSGIYVDNLKQSVQRCGEIYIGMRRDIFEEGAEVETMGENGEMATAILAEPHTDDQGVYQIRNDLSKGKYKVISDVTEATATRRDKTVKTLVNVATLAAQTDPDLSAICLSTAVVNMDGEGMSDLQDYIRAQLVAKGVVKPTPEEKAQLEASQQNQQPDPQAAALLALAQKEKALTGKAIADTDLSKAKTVESLAHAHSMGADATKTHVEAATTAAQPDGSGIAPIDASVTPASTRRIGIFDRMRGILAGQGG